MTEASDFAIIGHQENWQNIETIVNGIRADKRNPVSLADLQSIFPALPPRSLFDIDIASTHTRQRLKGKYIETFISPDQLVGTRYLRENINKVIGAAKVAIKHQVPVTAMGGFTSILLEGNLNLLPANEYATFTTGNTLTAALIMEGVKKACRMLGKNPSKSSTLIIGATGDIGSACTRYCKSLFQRVMVVARNEARLMKMAQNLQITEASTNLDDFTSAADVIIAAASSKDIRISNLKPDVIVADAGYPKNILADHLPSDARIFHAGMAHVHGGYSFTPGGYLQFYSFPYKNIGHGCVLESAVLAFEKRYESYSQGRGNITVEKIEEILEMSKKHGLTLAPFYNDKGLWEENRLAASYEKR